MHNEDVDVSVIIPVYNTEVYLRDCLDSVLAQRIKNIEVLCIDDGSTDSSPAILAEYADRDPRVRLIPQREGGKGPGTARNVALQAAKGKYIAFLDSDDLFHKDMLYELLHAARTSNADVSMCTIAKFSDRSEKGSYASCSFNQFLPEELDSRPFSWTDINDALFRLRFVAWNKLYLREFLLKWDIRFSEGIFFEDLIFSYQAMLRAERMRFVRKPLHFNRRQRDGATTFELGSRVYDAIEAMSQLQNFLEANPGYESLRERFEAFRFEKLYEYLHKNDPEHLPPFFETLKEFANSPHLDDNPHLRESTAEKRRLILEHDLLAFLAYELWEAKTRNASLLRQRRRLRQKLRRWTWVKRMVKGGARRLYRVFNRTPKEAVEGQ